MSSAQLQAAEASPVRVTDPQTQREYVLIRAELYEQVKGLLGEDDFDVREAYPLTDTVAAKEGWANVPPGTRTSLYKNPEYLKAAPFAQMTLDSIDTADPTHPTVKPVPYVGVQFVAIPEFQGIGTAVGQLFSAALAGDTTVDEALKRAQDLTTREMTKSGYIK